MTADIIDGTTSVTPSQTADMLNAVVEQNNTLAFRIENAQDSCELLAAFNMIAFVQDVWCAAGYGYKLIELRNRVKRRAEWLIREDESYLYGLRKNAVTRNSTESNLIRLRGILASV